jgi:hypothetical protein
VLYEVDAVLPQQFFTHVQRRVWRAPERRLAMAILRDAIECYQGTGTATEFTEAETWILSRDRGYLFSFENVCELLDINAEWLRRGLKQRRRMGHAAPRPTARGRP